MLIETFLRKQLGLKGHTVTKVAETEQCMVVDIDRLGSRLLRCGLCRQRCRKVHSVQKARVWRDLSMRKLPLKLRYRPRRVECPRCGVRVEDFPWAEPWARATTALSKKVARLARELSWQGTARQYGLNWKSVATTVKRAVQYGLKNRARPPVHVIGIDEVSRRRGQVYLTVVYDLERRVLLWVGDDRTEEAVRPFFTKEMGTRRCHTLPSVDSERESPLQAQPLVAAEKNPGISATTRKSACRRWCGGTRRSCAATTSKKPFSCSGITSSPNGPAITWRNGCVRPCAPAWSPSRNSYACCADI